DCRKIAEPRGQRGSHFVAQQQVPLRDDVEHALRLYVQLNEVGVGADRAVRSAQLDEQAALEQRFPEVSLGHRSEIHPGHEHAIRAGLHERLARRAHRLDVPHVLEWPVDLRDAWPYGLGDRGYVRELTLFYSAVEAELLDRRVADRNDVAGLQAVARHLR